MIFPVQVQTICTLFCPPKGVSCAPPPPPPPVCAETFLIGGSGMSPRTSSKSEIAAIRFPIAIVLCCDGVINIQLRNFNYQRYFSVHDQRYISGNANATLIRALAKRGIFYFATQGHGNQFPLPRRIAPMSMVKCAGALSPLELPRTTTTSSFPFVGVPFGSCMAWINVSRIAA